MYLIAIEFNATLRTLYMVRLTNIYFCINASSSILIVDTEYGVALPLRHVANWISVIPNRQRVLRALNSISWCRVGRVSFAACYQCAISGHVTSLTLALWHFHETHSISINSGHWNHVIESQFTLYHSHVISFYIRSNIYFCTSQKIHSTVQFTQNRWNIVENNTMRSRNNDRFYFVMIRHDCLTICCQIVFTVLCI